MCEKVWSIAKKELNSFFASPIAFIFLMVFLLVAQGTFFWVETFFARNIADARPLFEWMPVLLVFLVAAMTMRMWSEENRMGTLEFLLTLPISISRLVLGKFMACMIMVLIALALTLPIPITVSLLGDLDWGPVVGAYLASILLAGSYIAVGLFLSAVTSSQVVALILTVLVCGLFLFLGSPVLTPQVSTSGAEILALIGTSSRFESVTRGNIDFRDLYYYISLGAVFLTLNVYWLERIKWSFEGTSIKPAHTRWRLIATLLVLNFLVANFWIHKLSWARVDLTENKMYSISPATHAIINQLQEPLLIRGYFSLKTHPLLVPLVPQLRDIIREFGVIGKGKITAEFIDPRDNPDVEEEANQKYSIKPVPIQVSDRYSAGVVNSYFNILLQYGDKFEVLGFEDLIEIKVGGESKLDVRLRNPEYDIVRSLKKVLYGFQNVENLFATIKEPVRFVGYVSADSKLPPQLQNFSRALRKEVEDLQKKSAGKLEVNFVDPQADGGQIAKEIEANFGFRPMAASIFDPSPFFFYITLQQGKKIVQIALPAELNDSEAKKGLDAGLKRFSTGFTRVAGLVVPEPTPVQPWQRQMNMMPDQKEFNVLRQELSKAYDVQTIDLKKGVVPEEVDILTVIAPEKLDEKQVFALDQFLMKGGTVVMAASPYKISRDQTSLKASLNKSDVLSWLKAMGVTLEEKFVLDSSMDKYAIPIQRRAGGFVVQEIKLVDYPYFVDIRGKGMIQQGGITSGLPQLTLNWPSPIAIDTEKNKERLVTELVRSSDESWTSVSTSLTPNLQTGSFPQGTDMKPHLLGVAVEGVFESYFKGKPSPLLKKEEKEKKPEKEEEKKPGEEEKKEESTIAGVIDRSPSTARIILFSSAEFLNDQTLRIGAGLGSENYRNSLRLVENALDWSLEDRALLAMRGRGQFSRTLQNMEVSQQKTYEYANYAAALLGLVLVYVLYRMYRRRTQAMYRSLLIGQA